MKPESFLAKVGDDGRVTINIEIRRKLGIESNDFVEVTVSKVDLMTNSFHKFSRQRSRSTVSRQISATKFVRKDR